MHLLRTTCHADHRGRGSHDLVLIATDDNLTALDIKEDEDFRRQLAIGVVKTEFYDICEETDDYSVEIDEDFDAWTPEQKQKVADLMTDPKLLEKWGNDERWVYGDGSTDIFDHSTGYWETTVYHIVDLESRAGWPRRNR